MQLLLTRCNNNCKHSHRSSVLLYFLSVTLCQTRKSSFSMSMCFVKYFEFIVWCVFVVC